MVKKACCGEVSRIEERKISKYYTYKKIKKRSSKWLTSCSQLHKNKRKRQGEDWISQLPDEILVSILSRLTIKEAGRCSILSRRWRFLWTFYSGKFEIDYSATYSGYRSINLSYVSKILKSYRGSVVDELIICYPGKSKHFSVIDSWVDFASEKCVRRFELDLTPCLREWTYYIKKRYDFPGIERFLSGRNGNHGGFSSLTCLCLAYVDVTGEVLEQFLSTCSFLKQLVVRQSKTLEFLKVRGEALGLESLEVYSCSYLRLLEINADNLVLLTYDGSSKSLLLMNVPRLSKLTISDSICKSLNDRSRRHLSFIQHLECLKMQLPPKTRKQPPVSSLRLHKWNHLKHLELNIQRTYGRTLVCYITLIEACPSLSRFSLRYSFYMCLPGEIGDPDFEHESLKVVELIGFMGSNADIELAFHLLKIAVSLEKLIIVPGSSFDGCREHVRNQLAVRLPISVDLVIL